MSDFYLKGSGWDGVGDDPNAIACVLAIVNYGGHRYCIGTLEADVPEIIDGQNLHFVDAILNNPSHRESVDIFSRSATVGDMSFEVMGDWLPLDEMRRTGVPLQNADVDVYWHILNRGFALEQSLHLMSGKLANPMWDEERRIAKFKVEDQRLSGGSAFPPVVIHDGILSMDDQEAYGKVYPVVIGDMLKLPVLLKDEAGGVLDTYLVMHDVANEFTSDPFTALYEEDTSKGINTWGRGTDNDGNLYVFVLANEEIISSDVFVDVTGHTPATVDESLRWLLMNFSDDQDMFDLTSLARVQTELQGVTLGVAFNARERGNVVEAIRERLFTILPVVMIQRGGKYQFLPLTWDRDVRKTLSFDKNLVRRTHGPTETRRNQVYNDFTIRYAKSGFRGDWTGCIKKNWWVGYIFSDADCARSAQRYGKRAMKPIDAGSVIADAVGARWLMNWTVDTYSKMRVHTGYAANLDACDLNLMDTVRVLDEYHGWTHGPLFKIVGMERKTGQTIPLDLISIDDYHDVYATSGG